MGNKFGRNFKLTIQTSPNSPLKKVGGRLYPQSTTNTYSSNAVVPNKPADFALIIQPPFTVEVNIHMEIGAGDNNAVIKIYDLNETSRRELVKDLYNIQDGQTNNQYRLVALEGGYGRNLNKVFVGDLIEGYSIREGIDVVTYLRCVSGAYGRYNTFINQSFDPGVPNQQVVDYMINQIITAGNLQKGAISTIDGIAQTGYLATGDGFNIITKEFGSVFVQNNQMSLLQLQDVVTKLDPKNIYTISPENGLLGTPIRRGTYVDINLIFEPRILLGQLISLKSATAPYFNGIYKVLTIDHNGVFSNSKPGPLTTKLGLYLGSNTLNGWRYVPGL